MIQVLIADDHNGLRTAFASALNQHEGIHVVDVPDGRSAVARLVQGGIDVALIDMEMPDMKGDEVIRAVMADGGFRPRMLIYSGFIAPDLVRRALEAGACGYVLKDAEIVETVRVIKATNRGEVCLCPQALAMVGEDVVDEAVRKMSERAFRVSAEEIVEAFLKQELAKEDPEWPEEVKAVYRQVVASVPLADIGVLQILERARVSGGAVRSLYRVRVGLSIKASQTEMRLRLAAELQRTGFTVSDAAIGAGYQTSSALANARKRHREFGGPETDRHGQ